MKRFSDLSSEKQTLIYDKVLELKKAGLGYKKIIKRINKENEVKLALSTLSYWFNNKIKLLGGENWFKEKPSKELSYIIGVMFGDGFISINKARR